MKTKFWMMLVGCTMWILSACETGVVEDGEVGAKAAARIESALTANPHDVAGFFYEIWCQDGYSTSHYSPLEQEMLPPWLDPNAGPNHHFSDFFTILPEGQCKVCATPMQDERTPSAECHQVCSAFEVVGGQTTEIVLMAQCDGDPSGAGDIVAGLNDPPVIVGVSLNKFICTGEKLEVGIKAVDPNGDALTYNYAVVTWPEMPGPGTWQIYPNGNTFVFVAQTEGMYEITVTVSDPYGASTSLTFPIHVSECGVCCYTGGDSLDTFQIVDSQEECDSLPGKLVDLENCDDVCCWVEKWDAGIVGPRGLCEQHFPETQIVDDEKCKAPVCCKHEQGFTLTSGAECLYDLNGSVAPMGYCQEGERVCCKTDTGMMWTPIAECPEGQIADPGRCEWLEQRQEEQKL